MDDDLNTEKESETTSGIHTEASSTQTGTVVTVPASNDTPAQQFILLSQPGNGPLTVGVQNDAVGEPASKLIRLEGEDGQTYVLAVAGVSGDAAGITELQKTETVNADISDVSATITQVKTEKSGIAGPSKKSSNSAEDVTQAWFTTRDDKRVLQSKGHTWKQGQWTKDETDLLMENIDSYCKERGIKDPTEIIFEMTKDERKDFYRTIARGLQRPLFSVYRRVTRMYDQKNHMGKYTPEEMAKLRELRMKHGNDWAAIGAVLGRSASSVKDKCRLMKDTCNAGKWLPEEERRLASAVYELAGVKMGESVTHGLSWAAVAERVGTRSEKQCRTKWLNYLNWKQKGGSEWTRQDDINLILKIASLGASDDTEIDWNELSSDWSSVRSPQWLRGKWWSLKRHVPDYQDLVFADIIEILKTMHYQNVRIKSPGVRLRVQGRQANGEIGLQVPLSLQPGVSLDGEDSESTFQAYEVLQQWTPGNSNALLITQPHNNPAVSFSSASTMSTDHIIVHTLPVSQSDGHVKSGENVTVQMNHQPHVIISAASDDGSLDGSVITTSIQLPDGMDSSEQECHQYQLSSEACQMIDSQGEIITGQFSTTAVSAADLHADVAQSVLSSGASGADIVVLEPTSPPHFSQSNSNDGNELMSGFSDPILTSDATELMGSASDCENDKSQTGLSEDIQ
ncbi:cyclin-D-binding Myb-like transcription factor 1 [Haliotis cracherodii]|uniref:cyclin-D-binding Myb-like transcription factor 1 n=1 Tax=Haliotis cracherodii TaxID=6455 RepID=UPI0039EBDFCC